MLKVVFSLLFLLSHHQIFAQSRSTLKLKSEVDLYILNADGEYEVLETLRRNTILRFRTDTAVKDFFRHILILESPNLSDGSVSDINAKQLFIKRDVLERGSAFCFGCGARFSSGGSYNIRSNAQRIALIDKIIAAGSERLAKTVLQIQGQSYEVLNDNVTLSDGTYVPLTFPEAKRIANAWGFSIPNTEQAMAIARYAANNGSQYRAITRTPNNNLSSQLKSMNQMMNDPRMKQRAEAGREKLIDGHFKWYIHPQGKIYGFARGDGRFWQNRPSGAHVRDPEYYDYSHGVRLLRRQ